jgi:hypothetical protein
MVIIQGTHAKRHAASGFGHESSADDGERGENGAGPGCPGDLGERRGWAASPARTGGEQVAALSRVQPPLRHGLADGREAGWGWALWNFRGSFGILDSDRQDVSEEDWRGHQLDRAILEILQKA